MEDFAPGDTLKHGIQSVSGAMSNDRFGETKRERMSARRRPVEAHRCRTQSSRQAIDRPDLLADRLRLQNDGRKIGRDGVVLETFTLPLDAARLKARGIIDRISAHGYQEIVEGWRQLPNGQIEFTVRHMPVAD